jgi:hypothetical protein
MGSLQAHLGNIVSEYILECLPQVLSYHSQSSAQACRHSWGLQEKVIAFAVNNSL